jgi:hypothetical protein
MTWRDVWCAWLSWSDKFGAKAKTPIALSPTSELPASDACAAERGVLEHQQSQYRDAESRVAVEGMLWVPLEPSQREAVRHVAFCPPFSVLPHVEVDQLQGPAARIIVAESLWHGARFEIRLDQSDSQLQIVQFAYYASEIPERAVAD